MREREREREREGERERERGRERERERERDFLELSCWPLCAQIGEYLKVHDPGLVEYMTRSLMNLSYYWVPSLTLCTLYLPA